MPSKTRHDTSRPRRSCIVGPVHARHHQHVHDLPCPEPAQRDDRVVDLQTHLPCATGNIRAGKTKRSSPRRSAPNAAIVRARSGSFLPTHWHVSGRTTGTPEHRPDHPACRCICIVASEPIHSPMPPHTAGHRKPERRASPPGPGTHQVPARATGSSGSSRGSVRTHPNPAVSAHSGSRDRETPSGAARDGPDARRKNPTPRRGERRQCHQENAPTSQPSARRRRINEPRAR